jgi:hypothetical protein
MTPRPLQQRLQVQQLEDRLTPAGSQIPAGEFNWMQFSPTGELGQLIWNGQALVYRTRAGTGWTSETVASSTAFTRPQYDTVDQVQAATQTAQLVYTSNGVPHVFFLEKQYRWQTGLYQTLIRHYARTGGTWNLVETLRPSGETRWGPNNLVAAAGPNQSLHLLFTETTEAGTDVGQFGSGLLRYATNQGGTWTFTTIATTADLQYDVWIQGMRYAPRFLSLAVDAHGYAHVTYTPQFFISGAFGTVRSDLMYASNRSGRWQSQPVIRSQDGTADAGLGASVAVAPNGQVGIASYYVDRYDTGSAQASWLVYSTLNPDGTWTSTIPVRSPDGYVAADGPNFTGFAPQLLYDSLSQPTIVFSDEAAEHLPVSHSNQFAGQIRTTTLVNGTWQTRTLYRQANPLTNQLFFPVAAMAHGQTVVAGLRGVSTLDANRDPLSTHFILVDVGAVVSPPVSPPAVPAPPVPAPPLPPPVVPPPPAPVNPPQAPTAGIRPVLAVATAAGPITVVRLSYSNGASYWWTPFGSRFTGGASVARGDVNRDGIDDVLVGSGPGIPAQVNVYDGATRALLATYTPWGRSAEGVTVAAGDLTGDGVADLVLGTTGAGPARVAVLSGATGTLLRQFHPFGVGFTGGVRLAVGDVNRDGVPDVVVAPGGGSWQAVRVYDGRTLGASAQPVQLLGRLQAFATTYRGPQTLAVADVTGDGFADILVGTGAGFGRVQLFSGAGLNPANSPRPLFTKQVWPGRTGVNLALSADVDGDRRPELVVTATSSSHTLRFLTSQLTNIGWDGPEVFDPMPGITSAIYVG